MIGWLTSFDLFIDASSHLYMRVGPSIGWSVTCFFMPKMNGFLYENHQGSPTLTLLNVLGVLGVLNPLNVLNMARLSCIWAAERR